MSVFQALSLMIAFGMLVAVLSNKKDNKKAAPI
ncbi:putative holin-like toxin [Levilactobacillus brevis]